MGNVDDPRLKTYQRKQLRAQIGALQLPCWICGGPIDYAAPRYHPLAYVLDEVMPRAFGGDPLDPGNVNPAHWRCNAKHGQQITTYLRGKGIRGRRYKARSLRTSRIW